MRFNFFLILFLSLAIGATAADFPAQTVSYKIQWDCALFEKTAATAQVQISCYDSNYIAVLDGHSIPIEGTIYCINDTLQATYIPSGETLRPASEQIQYISGYYRKPHEGDRTYVNSPKSYRNIQGEGKLSADKTTMVAVKLTADMLAMFYYAKTVDFDNLPIGTPIEVPIIDPDGTHRSLQIVYNGITQFQGQDVYSLLANFTYNGELTNYPITTLIGVDSRLPVSFSASIRIGRVDMVME